MFQITLSIKERGDSFAGFFLPFISLNYFIWIFRSYYIKYGLLLGVLTKEILTEVQKRKSGRRERREKGESSGPNLW